MIQNDIMNLIESHIIYLLLSSGIMYVCRCFDAEFDVHDFFVIIYDMSNIIYFSNP